MTEGMMNIDVGGGRQRKVKVDYPSNSKRLKIEVEEEKPKQEKVVSGAVVTRKKGVASKIHDTFFSEDSNSVVQYVVMEVLVPAAKNMISDAVSQGVERLMFGDIRPRSTQGVRTGYTNYNRAQPQATQQRTMTRQARTTHDFSDVILETRGEAEDVLDRLRDLVDKYQVATVNDLYDLVGITGEFTDDNWGWYDLRSASVRAIRGGYLLLLPRTQPITQ
jgi:hypothetical protein